MEGDFCVLEFGVGAGEYGFLEHMEGFDGELGSSEPFGESSGTPTAKLKSGPKKLGDFVGNHDGTLVVSTRFMTFLGEHVTDIEFMPLRIVNGRKKLVSDDHHVAHLINHVDCIDMSKADPDWSWDKKAITRMNDRKLPLLADAIAPTRMLFYAKLFTALPLVRRAFGESILAAGMTHVRLCPIEDALAYL